MAAIGINKQTTNWLPWGFKLQSGLTLTVSNRLEVVPFYDGCYDGWTFYSSRIGTINGELLCFFFRNWFSKHLLWSVKLVTVDRYRYIPIFRNLPEEKVYVYIFTKSMRYLLDKRWRLTNSFAIVCQLSSWNNKFS